MHLIQLKIRGLGNLPQTDWIQVKNGINLFRCDGQAAGEKILQTIQTLNPPYDCLEEQPFQDLPTQTVTSSGFAKNIMAWKRTIVFGIFDSSAPLVRELGGITPYLYEADRIEVGRRLDCSRWFNFVELASSTRWSEISGAMTSLYENHAGRGSHAAEASKIIAGLTAIDRIKGDNARILANWLSRLKSDQPELEHIDTLLEKVLRSERFSEARTLLGMRMPLFIDLKPGDRDRPLRVETIERLNDQTRLQPIILLNLLGGQQPADAEEVTAFLQAIAGRYQCLCFVDQPHPQLCLELHIHTGKISQGVQAEPAPPAD